MTEERAKYEAGRDVSVTIDNLRLQVEALQAENAHQREISEGWMLNWKNERNRANDLETENERLTADLAAAILSRDHFGTLWDDLREDLDDERAGRPLLAKATERIDQLENELAALKTANQWISVEDRLPGKEGWYPTCQYHHGECVLQASVEE